MEKEKLEVLKYCYGHTSQMWAATIVSILLNCDFRDSTKELEKYLQEKYV